MARTITEIQSQIIGAMQSDAQLSGLTSPSKTALYRLFAYVVASSIWVLEVMFDQHKVDVQALIDAQKPHRLKWYVEKAKQFRFGQPLILDSDEYSNANLTDAQINALQIVKEAAVIEDTTASELIVKVASKDTTGKTIPLSVLQFASFGAYINDVKDAGVALKPITSIGDKLNLVIDIIYDALVLDAQGNRLDGTNTEGVQKSIKEFVNSMSFNSQFSGVALIDAVQKIEGVKAPIIRSIQASKFDSSTMQNVQNFYVPYSGYFNLDTFILTINFIL